MIRLDGLFEICEKYSTELLLGEVLAPYTSFKIGGECTALVDVNSDKCFIEAVKYLRENEIPFHVIGRGSNVLISDKGISGVVLLTTGMAGVEVNGEAIKCLAGTTLSYVCRCARENSLTGLEFAYGIPGTVGGALYMNAGAYGGEMSQVVKSCRYLAEDGTVKTLKTNKMELSYRHSIFEDNNGIILSMELELKGGDRFKIMSRMNELLEKRRSKQPLDYPSAGSTFKRPEGDFAARLIEECGLKGHGYGGAEVSTKHAGFVINTGGAIFDDVIRVIEDVKETVYKKTGTMLECEVKIIE